MNNSVVKKGNRLAPMLWSSLLYGIAFVLLFLYFGREQQYFGVVAQGAVLSEFSLLPILVYFFGIVIVMGIILWLTPISRLRLILRLLFAVFYGWGVFILLYLILPVHMAAPAALFLGVASGILWLATPFIWLQNLLLLFTLVSIAVLFGALISPFTMVYLLLALSLYDIVAVYFGYMMWMAKKLSESETLPAFILPIRTADWRLNLRQSNVKRIFDDESSEREYSLLGGGDMGFPLVFAVSVFFAKGLNGAIVMAAATLGGVAFAYLLQIYGLKGRPLPAIPPISLFMITGFLALNYL